MYATQVLVIKELSPEDSMYLHCLTKNLNNPKLINNLAKDYELNKNNKLYASYMNQFLGSHMKGEQLMVCENLFRLYGTSSEELREQGIQQAQKLYVPQIEKLMEENNHLKQVLNENNIAY